METQPVGLGPFVERPCTLYIHTILNTLYMLYVIGTVGPYTLPNLILHLDRSVAPYVNFQNTLSALDHPAAAYPFFFVPTTICIYICNV